MKNPLSHIVVWLVLIGPAFANHQERAATAGFWVMLLPTIFFGPAYGLRLSDALTPFPWSRWGLCLMIILTSWATYIATTKLAIHFFGSGFEAGGWGFLAAHFAGGFWPWLLKIGRSKLILPTALDQL